MTLLKKKSPQNSSEGNSCLNWTIFFFKKSKDLSASVHEHIGKKLNLVVQLSYPVFFFMLAEKRLKDYFKSSLAQIHI